MKRGLFFIFLVSCILNVGCSLGGEYGGVPRVVVTNKTHSLVFLVRDVLSARDRLKQKDLERLSQEKRVSGVYKLKVGEEVLVPKDEYRVYESCASLSIIRSYNKIIEEDTDLKPLCSL